MAPVEGCRLELVVSMQFECVRCSRVLWCRVTWARIVCALLILLVALQLLQVSLFSQLDVGSLLRHRDRLSSMLQRHLQATMDEMQRSVRASPAIDANGEYRVVHFLHRPRYIDSHINRTVTLTTHCSTDHLHRLVGLNERWKGPISIAVFVHGQRLSVVIKMIAQLLCCEPQLRANTAIHLIYPLSSGAFNDDPSFDVESLPSCENFTRSLSQQRRRADYTLDGIKYPNNLLRNVALRNARTRHVLPIDIDMLPNEGLHGDFVRYLHRNNDSAADQRTVYVVPVFEIRAHVAPPRDKMALLSLWRARLARPFYYELCAKCQRPTNYRMWANLSDVTMRVAYDVAWKDPWEPFYLAPASIPHYDERFKQYGFNRISQVRINIYQTY